jgi:crossover junction endodeoxyribonuclease RuvC
MTALPDKPKYYDATDALAVAICHYFGTNGIAAKKSTGVKKSSGWEKFIQQNPERVLKMR